MPEGTPPISNKKAEQWNQFLIWYKGKAEKELPNLELLDTDKGWEGTGYKDGKDYTDKKFQEYVTEKKLTNTEDLKVNDIPVIQKFYSDIHTDAASDPGYKAYWDDRLKLQGFDPATFNPAATVSGKQNFDGRIGTVTINEFLPMEEGSFSDEPGKVLKLPKAYGNEGNYQKAPGGGYYQKHITGASTTEPTTTTTEETTTTTTPVGVLPNIPVTPTRQIVEGSEEFEKVKLAPTKMKGDKIFKKVGEEEIEIVKAPIPSMKQGGRLSASKAKEMLKDGTANGKPLTDKQKGYFGAVAGGSNYMLKGGKLYCKDGAEFEVEEDDVELLGGGDLEYMDDNVVEVEGNSHTEGGVDIKANGKEVEVEDGEVIDMTNKEGRIYSDDMELEEFGGQTPAAVYKMAQEKIDKYKNDDRPFAKNIVAHHEKLKDYVFELQQSENGNNSNEYAEDGTIIPPTGDNPVEPPTEPGKRFFFVPEDKKFVAVGEDKIPKYSEKLKNATEYTPEKPEGYSSQTRFFAKDGNLLELTESQVYPILNSEQGKGAIEYYPVTPGQKKNKDVQSIYNDVESKFELSPAGTLGKAKPAEEGIFGTPTPEVKLTEEDLLFRKQEKDSYNALINGYKDKIKKELGPRQSVDPSLENVNIESPTMLTDYNQVLNMDESHLKKLFPNDSDLWIQAARDLRAEDNKSVGTTIINEMILELPKIREEYAHNAFLQGKQINEYSIDITATPQFNKYIDDKIASGSLRTDDGKEIQFNTMPEGQKEEIRNYIKGNLQTTIDLKTSMDRANAIMFDPTLENERKLIQQKTGIDVTQFKSEDEWMRILSQSNRKADEISKEYADLVSQIPAKIEKDVAYIQNDFKIADNQLLIDITNNLQALQVELNDQVQKGQIDPQAAEDYYNQQFKAAEGQRTELFNKYNRDYNRVAQQKIEAASKTLELKYEGEINALMKELGIEGVDIVKNAEMYNQLVLSQFKEIQGDRRTMLEGEATRLMSKKDDWLRISNSLSRGTLQIFEGLGGGLKWLGFYEAGNVLTDAMDLYNAENPQAKVEWTGISSLLNKDYWIEKFVPLLPFMAAFTIPGIGVGGAAASTATKIGLSGISKSIFQGIAGALATRPLESFMEAGSVYNQSLKEGKDVFEAADRAYKVFMDNMKLLFTDGLQLTMAFTKIGKLSGWKAGLVKAPLEMTMEGGEEVFQEFSVERLDNPYTTFLDYATSPAGQEVFTLGAVSGAIFALPDIASGSTGKDNQQQLGLLMDMMGDPNNMEGRHRQILQQAELLVARGTMTQDEYTGLQNKAEFILTKNRDIPVDLAPEIRKAVIFKLADIQDANNVVATSQDPTIQKTYQDKIKEYEKEVKELISGDQSTYWIGNANYTEKQFKELMGNDEIVSRLVDQGTEISIFNDPQLEEETVQRMAEFKPNTEAVMVAQQTYEIPEVQNPTEIEKQDMINRGVITETSTEEINNINAKRKAELDEVSALVDKVQKQKFEDEINQRYDKEIEQLKTKNKTAIKGKEVNKRDLSTEEIKAIEEKYGVTVEANIKTGSYEVTTTKSGQAGSVQLTEAKKEIEQLSSSDPTLVEAKSSITKVDVAQEDTYTPESITLEEAIAKLKAGETLLTYDENDLPVSITTEEELKIADQSGSLFVATPIVAETKRTEATEKALPEKTIPTKNKKFNWVKKESKWTLETPEGKSHGLSQRSVDNYKRELVDELFESGEIDTKEYPDTREARIESTNPKVLLEELKVSRETREEIKSSPEAIALEMLQAGVKRESFTEWSDENKIAMGVVGTYKLKKGEGTGLDNISQYLEQEGVYMSESELAELMLKHPGGLRQFLNEQVPEIRKIEGALSSMGINYDYALKKLSEPKVDVATKDQEYSDVPFSKGTQNEGLQFGKRLQGLVDTLRAGAPNIKVNFVSGEFLKTLQKKKTNLFAIQGERGPIGAFDPDTGEVYYNESALNTGTAIEEFAHAWLQVMKATKPELYEAATKMIKGTKYFTDIVTSTEYGGAPLDIQLNEAIAKAIREKGEKSYGNPLKSWLKEFWAMVKDLLRKIGINLDDRLDINNLSIENLTKMAVKDILSNRPWTLTDSIELKNGNVKVENRSVLRQKNPTPTIIQETRRKYLSVTKGANPLALQAVEGLKAREKALNEKLQREYNNALSKEWMPYIKEMDPTATTKFFNTVNEYLNTSDLTKLTGMPENIVKSMINLRALIDKTTKTFISELDPESYITHIGSDLNLYLTENFEIARRHEGALDSFEVNKQKELSNLTKSLLSLSTEERYRHLTEVRNELLSDLKKLGVEAENLSFDVNQLFDKEEVAAKETGRLFNHVQQLIEDVYNAKREIANQEFDNNHVAQIEYQKVGEEYDIRVVHKDGSDQSMTLTPKEIEILFGKNYLSIILKNEAGNMEVSEKLLLQNNPLYETIQKNTGKYVTRAYFKWEKPEWWKRNWKNQLETTVDEQGRTLYDISYNYVKKQLELSNIQTLSIEKKGDNYHITATNISGTQSQIKLDTKNFEFLKQSNGGFIKDGEFEIIKREVNKGPQTFGGEQDPLQLLRNSSPQYLIPFEVSDNVTQQTMANLATGTDIQVGFFRMSADLDRFKGDILKRKEEIPEEMRYLMGEIADPQLSVMKTILAQSLAISSYQKFNTIAQENGLFTDNPTGMISAYVMDADTYTEQVKLRPSLRDEMVAVDGSKLFMAGTKNNGTIYMTKEAYDIFFPDNTKLAAQALRVYYMVTSLLKFGYTNLNPSSRARNVVSNIIAFGRTGNLNPKYMLDAVNIVYSDMATAAQVWSGFLDIPTTIERGAGLLKRKITGQTTESLKELKALVVRLGLGEGSIELQGLETLQEIGVAEKLTGYKDTGIAKTAKFLEKHGKSSIKNIAAGYGAADDILRVAVFLQQKDMFTKANKWNQDNGKLVWTEEQINKLAAESAIRLTPSYSRLPEVVRVMGYVPGFGTFLKWTASQYRVAYNQFADAAAGIASENPVLKLDGVRKLSGYAGALLMIPVIAKLMFNHYGWDDDEKEAVRDLDPTWMKNNVWIPLAPPGKEPKRINLSYIDPSSMWHEGAVAFMRADNPVEGLGNAIIEMSNPFVGSDILLNTIQEMQSGTNSYGGPLFDPYENATEKSKKRFEYFLGRMVAPQLKMIQNFQKDPQMETVNWALGAKISQRAVDRSFTNQIRSIQNKFNGFPGTGLEKARKKEKVSEKYYINRGTELFEEGKQLIRSMLTLGYSSTEVYGILLNAGIGKGSETEGGFNLKALGFEMEPNGDGGWEFTGTYNPNTTFVPKVIEEEEAE